MLCIIQTQVSGFKDYTASPPLQPIVLGGNNAVMAIAAERPASLPSNSQDLMWPQAIARVAALYSSCASSHFRCRATRHQECIRENFANIINILMAHSLMWASCISPYHRPNLRRLYHVLSSMFCSCDCCQRSRHCAHRWQSKKTVLY